MGMECFNVVLRPHVDASDVEMTMHDIGGVIAARSTPAGRLYYEVCDPSGIVELEARPSGDLSCRFAICQPPDADELFVKVILTLADRLRADVRLGSVCIPASSYDQAEVAIRLGIRSKREKWQSVFGERRVVARCDEALKMFTGSRS